MTEGVQIRISTRSISSVTIVEIMGIFAMIARRGGNHPNPMRSIRDQIRTSMMTSIGTSIRTSVRTTRRIILLLMVCVIYFVCSESLFTTSASDHWVVDSGSTSHVARNESGFSSLKPIEKGTRFIYLGTTAKADILGVGDYTLKLPSGGKLILKDTVYSPNEKEYDLRF
jgi:hypothetical protein